MGHFLAACKPAVSYRPQAGRFLAEDPLSFSAGDANLYRYVFNTPVNVTDPSGEFIWFIGVAVFVGGIIVLTPSPVGPVGGPGGASPELIDQIHRQNASNVLDVLPPTSVVKTTVELFYGRDLLTGEELPLWQRAIHVSLGWLPFLPALCRRIRWWPQVRPTGAIADGVTIDPAVKAVGDEIAAWLGEGFVIKRKDAKAFVALSKDGTRRFRIDFHGHGYPPHAHLEVWDAKAGKFIDAIPGRHHLYLKE